MSAGLDEDMIDELRASVRGVLTRAGADRSPFADAWAPEPMDRVAWQQAGDLGWTSLLVSARWGGSEAGLAAAVAVVHELGGELSTIPYLGSAVLAVTALEQAGDDEQRARWLPDLAAGTTRSAAALTGPGGRVAPDLLDVCAAPTQRGWALTGDAGLVLDATGADFLIVAALVDGDPALFVVDTGRDGVRIEPQLVVDRTRNVARVRFDDVDVATSERLTNGDVSARDVVIERGSLAAAADACGAARRALDLSVQYAKDRHQFGRPIGSFQAIKHKLTDMWVVMQGAELAVGAAARAIDGGDPAARRMAAVAGAFARDAASKIAGDAIQVHGGIGYTWEHLGHRLWKRVKFDEVFLGDASVERERLASLLLDRRTAS
jgi:alkylation response protein AidB-like acyl-CoA dehydrogenase